VGPGVIVERYDLCFGGFTRFGGDLLSHVLRRSTIGATALNGRVRDGTGCFARAMTTKPGKTLVECPDAVGRLRTDRLQPPVLRLECFKSSTLCFRVCF
jgi:hypothetical protein